MVKNERDTIKFRFSKMESVDDFVNLLNLVNPYKDDEGVIPEYGIIRKKSVVDFTAFIFKEFFIKKKSGGERRIIAPIGQLKHIQTCLRILLDLIYEPKKYVNGFVTGKSIVDNAKAHISKNYVFNIDLQDFFPTISVQSIKSVLTYPPFYLNLSDEREKLADLIANLCCYKGFLPQGCPTSPIISNIICHKLDHRLNYLAIKNEICYTRYADDITFSSDENIFNDDFKAEMTNIIEEQGFKINEKKVRLQSAFYRQEVTGLTVNDKVNVSKKYSRSVRAMLHNWGKMGYQKATYIFRGHYSLNLGHRKKGDLPSLKGVLLGKIQFMQMVRGKEDALIKRYVQQFNQLSENLSKSIIDNKIKSKTIVTFQQKKLNQRPIDLGTVGFFTIGQNGTRMVYNEDFDTYSLQFPLIFIPTGEIVEYKWAKIQTNADKNKNSYRVFFGELTNDLFGKDGLILAKAGSKRFYAE